MPSSSPTKPSSPGNADKANIQVLEEELMVFTLRTGSAQAASAVASVIDSQSTSLPLPTTGKDFNFHLIKPTGLLVGTQGTPAGFLFGMAQQAAYGLPKPDLVLGRSAIWLISAQPKPPN
ncbi:hypothetical protein PCANC_19481 [Puccinia coronata f. sp. avenae]|uniref:Uncharacterized protein n=1 Tax=Puccinia coronata f. sp. avenae TaxID=200324 RepID=A0A2N5U929_9BASI|nr:hypothetical protein PCANC_25735 [Puccinia coronata f. sp. avenae]PLW34241.1 hypothetical protein PCANC_19481 [Puccinia coronata f. sp. avenae]